MSASAKDASGEMWEGGGRRFRVEKVVGNGAFGIVWRAQEEVESSPVAMMKIELASVT